MTEQPWWRGAAIYQIYIRSFCDSNGDGQGDLPGVISKLDYIRDLGVDAIWLSPLHPSPDRDWGYDVSDYEGIHPDYGTHADFDRLLSEAHARGVKVMLDEVLAHTSDEHPWFVDSLQNGEKREWYVWAPPKADGTAPNNWLSAFGGPAWSYQPARREYYHHKFLRQQPKLNWRSPAATIAALGVLEHWLARGVDGFRLDVANAFFHDPALTDNPAVRMAERTDAMWGHAPYLQLHHHDANLPDNIEALDEIRRTVERWPDRFVMGEFSEEPARCGAFTSPEEGLHSGYSFPLLQARRLAPDFIRLHYNLLARFPAHWPCVAFSNHDVVRTVSRFGGDDPPPDLAKLMLGLLLSLKGTALLYQGEELGLPEADIRRDQIRDPVGDLYWPYTGGRDGCRTPIPWDAAAPNLGFTSGVPWLPLSPKHRALAVSEQERDPESALNFARRFLTFRRSSAALRWGEMSFVDASPPLLGFIREWDCEKLLCLFNMSGEAAEFTHELVGGVEQSGVSFGGAAVGNRVELAPYGSWFGRLSKASSTASMGSSTQR
ncbi:MAG TPA: alpha-amylase family glycosyl hydrolase [Rhizomicrobium sp.]|nr:alpha-amylase family glycosyl hydrolase [Rhizomicrobium sp.]